jgi:hypothetical protein
LPTNDALPKAKAAALRAQEIDDSLAETQFALSQIKDLLRRLNLSVQ